GCVKSISFFISNFIADAGYDRYKNESDSSHIYKAADKSAGTQNHRNEYIRTTANNLQCYGPFYNQFDDTGVRQHFTERHHSDHRDDQRATEHTAVDLSRSHNACKNDQRHSEPAWPVCSDCKPHIENRNENRKYID